MKKNGKFLTLVLAGTISASLMACGSAPDTAAKKETAGAGSAAGTTAEVTLSLTHGQATSHPFQAGAERFGELVAEKTNGRIAVEIYPAGQIAAGAKAVEMVQMGTADIALESTMSGENFIPEMGVLNLPFLFDTDEQVYKVLDGDVGKELEAVSEKAGFKILGWMHNGFRDISNAVKPINGPDDLKGLKIRVPESQVFLKTFETLGAVPTPMAVSEVFTAMQLKTVDGQENPSSIFLNNKYNEVNDYYSITHHIFTAEPLFMNLDKFNSLSAEDQNAVLEAAKEASVYQREVGIEAAERELQEIKDLGVHVNEIADDQKAAFKSAMEPVYASFEAQYGELIKEIQEAAK